MMEYKNGIILAAHGNFCDGMESAIQLIAGDMENLRTVNFIEGDNFEKIDEGLKKAYEELEDKKNILVLTDLKGGTPFNRAVLNFGEYDNVRVISGVNFAMVYQGIITDTEEIDDYAKEVMDAGKEAIDVFQVVETKDHDEELDGI